MSANDQVPNPDTPVHEQLQKEHNNRLGAVYDAVYKFTQARQASLRRKCNDTVSVVLFNRRAKTIYQNQPLDSSNIFSEMIKHNAEPGTNFSVAIEQAGEVCLSNYDPQRYDIIEIYFFWNWILYYY